MEKKITPRCNKITLENAASLLKAYLTKKPYHLLI